MKQLWLSVAVLLAVAAWGGVAPSVSAQASGKITGAVTGPNGPLVGVTVQVVNNQGVVVGKAVTTSNGAYAVDNLPPGRYTVQVVISSGKVAATGVGALTTDLPAVVVDLSLTSSQLAPAAVAAGSGGGMGTTTKVVLVAAAAGAGIFIAVATKDDTSPTR